MRYVVHNTARIKNNKPAMIAGAITLQMAIECGQRYGRGDFIVVDRETGRKYDKTGKQL